MRYPREGHRVVPISSSQGSCARISLLGEGGALSTNGVEFSCAKWASDQRVRGSADMVINQMVIERLESMTRFAMPKRGRFRALFNKEAYETSLHLSPASSPTLIHGQPFLG